MCEQHEAARAALSATGQGPDLRTALTEYERVVIHDALADVEAEALRQAENWTGRSREENYRITAAGAKALREKWAALSAIGDTPQQKMEK